MSWKERIGQPKYFQPFILIQSEGSSNNVDNIIEFLHTDTYDKIENDEKESRPETHTLKEEAEIIQAREKISRLLLSAPSPTKNIKIDAMDW